MKDHLLVTMLRDVGDEALAYVLGEAVEEFDTRNGHSRTTSMLMALVELYKAREKQRPTPIRHKGV